MDAIAFILGHPRSGKTYFTSVLVYMLAALNKKILILCPSNTAVDTLAATIEKAAPEAKAVRFHSLNFEHSTISDQTRKATSFTAEGVPDADPQESEDLEDPDVQQKREFYTRLVAQGLQLGKRQRGKAGRPNFR
ncbi:MAG: hypothetical protein Q9225_003423 [Loekoesia sp. 1 TL-2023]